MHMTPDDSLGFDVWLEGLLRSAASESEEGSPLKIVDRDWLRGFYAAEGPTTETAVMRAFLDHQVALARDAIRLVLGDLQRTTGERPAVVIEEWMGSSVRIEIDGSADTPFRPWSEVLEALVEVASYIQEQLDQSPLGIWPVCELHDVGLHAEVHGERAVWRCRLAGHTVAPIGQLGATSAPTTN
jgi:hypothetical protein